MSFQSLNTGDYGLGIDGDILHTGGIGSCVVICLWDSRTKVGGMAHMLLPKNDQEPGDEPRSLGLSPDTAIPELLKCMIARGVFKKNIRAKLVGAGNMFPGESDFIANIGKTILLKTEEILLVECVPIVAMSVGGHLGRRVEFNLGNGEVEIRFVGGERHVI